MVESEKARVDPQRLLVILMGSIGDVVRGLSIVDPIKRTFPQIHLTWLVEPTCEPIVTLHRGIDSTLVFQRKRWFYGALQLAKELRLRNFDTVLDLQRHAKSGFFSFLTGAPRRIGFHRKNCKEFNWLFSSETIAARDDSLPKIEHYHLFLERLGVVDRSPFSFGLNEVAFAKKEFFTGIAAPYIGLILGSSWETKNWPVTGYEELIRAILARLTSHSIVLIGDGSRVADAHYLVSKFDSHVKIIDLVAKTSLTDLIPLIEGAAVCVGPDSGPGHIAAALSVPYVTIFGPTPRVRNAPYGSEDLAVESKVACAPCARKVCPGLGKVCMRLVSPHEVFDKLLEGLKKRTTSLALV